MTDDLDDFEFCEPKCRELEVRSDGGHECVECGGIYWYEFKSSWTRFTPSEWKEALENEFQEQSEDDSDDVGEDETKTVYTNEIARQVRELCDDVHPVKLREVLRAVQDAHESNHFAPKGHHPDYVKALLNVLRRCFERWDENRESMGGEYHDDKRQRFLNEIGNIVSEFDVGGSEGGS